MNERQQPAVLVTRLQVAAEQNLGLGRQELCKPSRGFGTETLGGSGPARLFWRVDTQQTNGLGLVLYLDDDGVAIDYSSDNRCQPASIPRPSNVGLGRRST